MATSEYCQMQWTQRLALVQHNLHIASRTGRFDFFKSLQVALFSTGVDHVGTLAKVMTDDAETSDIAADTLIAQLDKFIAVIAYVHEDAYKNVHDAAQKWLFFNETPSEVQLHRLNELITEQKRMTEQSIDKMMDSASSLIGLQQRPEVRDEAAMVFTLGTTFVADALSLCLSGMEIALQVSIQGGHSWLLEDRWKLIQETIASSVTAMKCVYKLMAVVDPTSNTALESQPLLQPAQHHHQRSPSVDMQAHSLLRRMSTALSLSSSSGSSQSSLYGTPMSRKSSLASAFSAVSPSIYSSARHSLVSNGAYQSPPQSAGGGTDSLGSFQFHALAPIPHTPSEGSTTLRNPFDNEPLRESLYEDSDLAQSRLEQEPHDNGFDGKRSGQRLLERRLSDSIAPESSSTTNDDNYNKGDDPNSKAFLYNQQAQGKSATGQEDEEASAIKQRRRSTTIYGDAPILLCDNTGSAESRALEGVVARERYVDAPDDVNTRASASPLVVYR